MQSTSVALSRSQRNTQDHARIAEESSAVLQAAREGRLHAHQPTPGAAPLARYDLAQASVEERKESDDDARARPAVLEPYRGDAGRMPNVQARLAGPVPQYSRLIERLGTGSSKHTQHAGMSIDRSGSPQRSARLVLEESSRVKPKAQAPPAPSASTDEPLYRACQVLNKASALLAEKEYRVQVTAGAIAAAMQAQSQPPVAVAGIDDQDLSNARFAPPLRQPKESLPSSSLASASTGKPNEALRRPKLATPAEYLKAYSQSTSPLSQPGGIGSESTVPLQTPSAPPAPPKAAKPPTPATRASSGSGASTGAGGRGGPGSAPPAPPGGAAPPIASQGAQLLGGDRSVKAGHMVPSKPPPVSSSTTLTTGHVRPVEAQQHHLKPPAGSLDREGEVESRAASDKAASESAQVQAAGYELQLAVQELLNLVQLTEKVLSDPRLSVAPASIVSPIQAACNAARLQANQALELVGSAGK